MPTAPLYAEYVMPGQYDNFFRWCVTQWNPTLNDGNVVAPTGWFAVVQVDDDDIAAYVSDFGEPMFARIQPGRYLYQQDNDGIVWIHEHKSERRLLADYSRLIREYAKWDDAVTHECDGLPLSQTTCPDRAAHM